MADLHLLYFRTYNTIIPLDSYGLLGNLSDFKASVVESFRWQDTVFPIITIISARMAFRKRRSSVDGNAASPRKPYRVRLRYLTLPLMVLLVLFSVLRVKGGFRSAYASRVATNQFASVVPMYTIGGSLCYQMFKNAEEYTPDIDEHITSWLAEHNGERVYADFGTCENVIVIVAESFESWVVELEYEGKEITPNINRLLKAEGVFYAPHVQSQAKGGRSIDGQLLVNTGLLPIENGTYSSQYVDSRYPSLVKAFRQKYPDAEASVYTVDDPMVWNQGLVAQAFGYDNLYDKTLFVTSEKVGPKKKTGDVPFFSKCADLITAEEKGDKHYYRQLVTYSGHTPFRLPAELAMISFETDIPERTRNYMTMANYTDHAIGSFVEKLKAAGLFERTTIVITGDHEGLGRRRGELVQPLAKDGSIRTEDFVPLIVLNVPVTVRYEPVMGQIDIYPTLLDLFGLNRYMWKGLGVSAFDPGKIPVAVNIHGEVVGDSDGVPEGKIDHLKQAWEISDKIIRFDYFGRMER